jgi:hypothetical protein
MKRDHGTVLFFTVLMFQRLFLETFFQQQVTIPEPVEPLHSMTL